MTAATIKQHLFIVFFLFVVGSQNESKGTSTGTRAPTLTQNVLEVDENVLQDTPKRLKEFKTTTTQLQTLKRI